MRLTVEQMEKNWAPSVPPGGRALPIRLGELLYLLAGAQGWPDHLRAVDPRRRQAHAGAADLAACYGPHGKPLSAKEGEWPTRRSAAMVRLVANLLDLPERTIQRRLRIA